MKTRKLFLVAILAVFAVSTMNAQFSNTWVRGDTLIFLSNYLDVDNNLTSDLTLSNDSIRRALFTPPNTTDFDSLILRPIYVLDSRFYVTNNAELTIDAGCVIKATYGIGLGAPALIVSRGSKLFANGTEDKPIIFTTVEDQLDGSYPLLNQGRWGGVIVLGNDYCNLLSGDLWVSPGVSHIEGLDKPETRHHYGNAAALKDGGPYENESSGSITYVSIRHGGAVIGEANEINGLTLGGVGNGTIIENVEVISNLDDAFEFFGGSVNVKYLNALFCDDDYIDWDQGYDGKGMFIYGLQLPANDNPVYSREGDNGMEIDGDDKDDYDTDPDDPGTLSSAVFYNCTFIGNGNDEGMEAKERTQGTIRNSIFANFASGLHLNDGRGTGGYDALHEWNEGRFIVENNIFQANGRALKVAGADPTTAQTTKFETDDENKVGAPILADLRINATNNGIIKEVNPVPASATTTITPLAAYPADAFWGGGVSYHGAFLPGSAGPDWVAGANVINNIGLKCPSDLDKDNDTDIDDFAIWLPSFGTQCGQ